MNTLRVLKFQIFVFLIFSAQYVSAADYDFYMDFSQCQSTVAYLALSKESLKILPGDPSILACKRSSKLVNCDIYFTNNLERIKGNSEQYEIIIDSPSLLYFSSKSGSEFIAIDTVNHAAGITTRIVHEKFIGSKVCQGIYTTDFELMKLGKQK